MSATHSLVPGLGYVNEIDSKHNLVPGAGYLNEAGTVYQYLYPISDIATNGWLASQRRNLLTHTEALDNAAWTKVDVTITVDDDAPPWDTSDYVATNGGIEFENNVIQSVNYAEDTDYTISVFSRAGDATACQIFTYDLTNAVQAAVFNLTLGVVGDISGDVVAGIESAGNGYYRCWMRFNSLTGSPTLKQIKFGPVTPNNNEGVYLTRMQAEVGSSTTPYQRIEASYDDTILYQSLDETVASDADYIYSPPNPTTQQFEVRLTPASDPLSSTNHTITLRLQAINADTTFDLNLVQNTTVLDSWSEAVTVAAGVVERSRTLSGAVADSISNYGDLRVRGVARAP